MGAWIETNLVLVNNIKGRSHPTWVRGLKPELMCNSSAVQPVAPYVGAWIETYDLAAKKFTNEVAPYVGAWIETKESGQELKKASSRTLRGCVD